MPKILPGFVAVLLLLACTQARSDTVASVSAVAQPVWIQLDGIQSELDRSNDINVGDKISSGAGGRAEIRLWSGVMLRLYPNSEILVRTAQEQDISGTTIPELLLQRGRLCLQSGPPTSTGRNFRLNLASRLLVTIHQSAHICAVHQDDSSALGLLAGSVQLTNRIEPAIVILSEPGFEFRLAEDGTYRLLPPGSDDSIAAVDDEPFITETIGDSRSEAESTGVIEAKTGELASPPSLEPSTQAETRRDTTATDTASGASSDWVYTVYLFSTRSAEVADEVNQKLQRAGHDTRIVVSTKDSLTRYRIAVSGFSTRQSAQDYSDSIIGKNGIRDTWIGRDRSAGAD